MYLRIHTKNGFTLMEMMVAIALSGLILTGLFKLFSIAQASYSRQNQVTEMNQNAHYTITKLSDLFMQAGAGLPGKRLAVITATSPSDITIMVNPKGAYNKFSSRIYPEVQIIPVSNVALFNKTTQLTRIYAMDTLADPQTLVIDKGYNSAGFTNGLNKTTNEIMLTVADTFAAGDAIYANVSQRYFLNGTNLCVDSASNIIAENIDSLSITFMDTLMTPTTVWQDMAMSRVAVTARSALPDPGYNGYPDHYHRISFDITFRLKNKI